MGESNKDGPDLLAMKESAASDAAGEAGREHAAQVIQKTYRGHRTRRQLKGYGLDPSTRWLEAVRDAQYHKLTTPLPPSSQIKAESQSEAPKANKNWYRATQIARRAGADDRSPSVSDVSSGDLFTDSDNGESPTLSPEEQERLRKRRAEARENRKKSAKMMDLQYFLEMVDQKHRYGSNLRKYHKHWQTQVTSQNFFYWLDYGDGLKVELPECSRSRLDKEQVRYLSREERLQYMVLVNRKGLLEWAKNGELVWTKDELYKDSVKGIVPITDPAPKFKYNVRPDGLSSDSSFSESEEEENGEEGDEAERYVNEDFHRAKGPAKLKHVSAAVLFNHMIRTSMKKGHKWIFVAGDCLKSLVVEFLLIKATDTSFRLYVGYKQSGAFQHSSFLHGSRIAAAGLIKIKHGQLRSLSPLSGHYRPPVDNFRLFVQSLRDEGVDMSRVSISKSYAVLLGMESYKKSKKKIENAESTLIHHKNKVLHPEKVKQKEEASRDKSQSAERERQHLERLRREEEKKGIAEKADKSFKGRISKSLTMLSGKASKNSEKTAVEGRRVSGTGPEDGGPAPEGGR